MLTKESKKALLVLLVGVLFPIITYQVDPRIMWTLLCIPSFCIGYGVFFFVGLKFKEKPRRFRYEDDFKDG